MLFALSLFGERRKDGFQNRLFSLLNYGYIYTVKCLNLNTPFCGFSFSCLFALYIHTEDIKAMNEPTLNICSKPKKVRKNFL